MSEFIIASISDQDRFIFYDKLGKMCVTNRKEKAARFPDSKKTWKVLITQMSKKKRDGWKIAAYEVEPIKVKEPSVNTTEAREMFAIRPGSSLMLVGDREQGLALLTNETLIRFFQGVLNGEEKEEIT